MRTRGEQGKGSAAARSGSGLHCLLHFCLKKGHTTTHRQLLRALEDPGWQESGLARQGPGNMAQAVFACLCTKLLIVVVPGYN